MIFYDRPPEGGKHPVVRVGTILLAMLGLYPQYTAMVTVLMLAGVIQVDKPSPHIASWGVYPDGESTQMFQRIISNLEESDSL